MKKAAFISLGILLFTLSSCTLIPNDDSALADASDTGNDAAAQEQYDEGKIENEPVEDIPKFHIYDLNEDGILQTSELPYPTAECFLASADYLEANEFPDEFVRIYDFCSRAEIDEILPHMAENTTLIIPRIVIYAKYSDSAGNTCYIGSIGEYYYELDSRTDKLPNVQYLFSGGGFAYSLITVAPNGEITIEKTLDGDDNTERIKRFCGPYTELANALNEGKGIMDDPIFTMPTENELLAAYMDFYFGK